jgi:hypothetical protein
MEATGSFRTLISFFPVEEPGIHSKVHVCINSVHVGVTVCHFHVTEVK